MGKYTCAIFDLDGVLVDTAKFHYLAWKKTANTLGFDISIDDDQKLKGISRMEALNILLDMGEVNTTNLDLQYVANKKNEWYLRYVEMITRHSLLPGALELITQLRELKVSIALGSASKNAKLVLHKLELFDCFDVIIDGEVVGTPKPDPAVFLKAAELLRINAEECVVFEDSHAGILSAMHAGMYSVAVGINNFNSLADMNVTNLLQNNIISLFNSGD